MYTFKRLAAFAGIAVMSAALASCAGTTNVNTDMTTTPKAKSIEFESVKAPATDAEKRKSSPPAVQ